MLQQWFDQSVGDSRYNALQVTVQEHANHGVTFLAAYTLAHANADGCNLGASCESQNPYDRHSDYGTSDLNEKNVFSVAFTAAVAIRPVSQQARRQRGWRMGAQWHCAGNFRAALPGERRRRSFEYRLLSHGKDERQLATRTRDGLHTREEWFNTSAFTAPTNYTYGNEKVNSLVSQHFNDVDMSLFRDFHIGLGEERYFEFRAESFNLFNNVVWSHSGLRLAPTRIMAKSQANEMRMARDSCR